MADDKNTKLLLKRLQSANKAEILVAINELKDTGQPELIPALLDVLIIHNDNQIHSAVFGILNDLKNQRCTHEIVNALKSNKYKVFQKSIYVSCWSSGLDYSEYLPFFVDLFIVEDFINAFEVFTLIETFEREFDALLLDNLLRKLKSGTLSNDETKNNLLNALVQLLENWKTLAINPN